MPNGTQLCLCFLGSSCWARYLEHQKSEKNTKRDLVPETKRSLLFAKHVGGKCQKVLNYVYVSYGISCWAIYLEHQKSQKTPKGTLFQKQKDRYCLQSMCQGNAKWYLIMSTKSTLPTELASQPVTENIRSFKNYQKGPCSRDKKTPIDCKACGREMPNGTKSCLCFLRK